MKIKSKKEWLFYGMFLLFFILFIIFGILFGVSYTLQMNENQEFDELAELVAAEEVQTEAASDPEDVTASTEEEQNKVIDPAVRYAALFERNSDFIGWLQIKGTGINYPVMSTPEDPEYYIHRNFSGKYSYSGVPFFGKDCSLRSDNIIIYGHNMKNGTMFSDLGNYADQSYFEQHPTITFNTLAAYGSYEIVGAFYEKVHNQGEENVFRYYDYGGSLTEQQYEAYIQQVKAISAIDSGITPAYGEPLLTLSTCSYHTQNGRFVVVARKIDPD